jgi:hypothetical protein
MKTITIDSKLRTRIPITNAQLTDFCRRWGIIEIALFGSVLRDDFRPDSDIDVLVTLTPNHSWGLEFIQMREELSTLLQRPIDLLTRQSIMNSRNILRRQIILDTAEVIYVA